MATPSNALVGYAVLRANYNASAQNYLDNFAPFVLSVLAESGKSFLERHVIADAIRSQFGLNIPSLVIGRLVRRTNREQLTEPVGTDAVALTPKGLGSAPTIAEEVTQYRRRQEELVQLFTEFVEARYQEHRSILPPDVGVTLAEYFDRHAVPLLNEGLRGRTREGSGNPGVDFLVSAFVTDLSMRDQTRFSYVVEAAKGAMLASVLLLDTSGLSDSLKELSLVLDTPILMDILGFHGDLACTATEEVLQLARAQGARLVTFDHSVTELDGVLEAISQALRKGARSRATNTGYLHFVEQGSTPVDILMIQQSLTQLLRDSSIEIIARPDDYYKYGLDEGKLEELIQQKVHYSQDAARVNDVITLSSTHRLRRGRGSKAFEHARAVFVTSNTALVRGAVEFGSGDAFPLAITIEALASILWVRSPTTSPDAPRQILLAVAFAGMQPSAHLWTKYLDEVDRLEASDAVSTDQAIVLRSSRFSREALMEETLGEANDLKTDAPLAVLERLQRETAEPLEQKVQELQEAAARAEASAKKADAERAALIKLAEVESANVRARIRQRAEDVARRRVRGIAWSIRVILLAAGLAAVVFLVAVPNPSARPAVVVVSVVGILAFVVPFFPPLENVLANLQTSLATRGERRRLLDAGYEPTDEPPSASTTSAQ